MAAHSEVMGFNGYCQVFLRSTNRPEVTTYAERLRVCAEYFQTGVIKGSEQKWRVTPWEAGGIWFDRGRPSAI